MRGFGVVLLIAGTLWGFIAFNGDTTVTTEGKYIGGVYIPSQTVHNIGKMDERRNHLMVAGLMIVVGVILFALGKESAPSNTHRAKEGITEKTRKCPYCAESVKAEAVICRFCQRDLPPLPTIETASGGQVIGDLSCPTGTPICIWRENLMKEYGIQGKGDAYFWNGKLFASFDSVVAALTECRDKAEKKGAASAA